MPQASSGRRGIVDPDVDALHELPADVDVVVLDEHELAGEARVAGELRDLAQQRLARAVVRVRLAREHELDRHRRVVDERGEGLDVAQHQRGALVGGEAAGEADRQGVEAQGPAHRGDDVRGLAAALGLLGGAPAHGVDELHLQRLVRFPQLAVVDGVDAIPERGVARARGPVGAEVAVVDLAHLRREPGRHVDAVGDVADRHAIFAAIGIKRAPHRARDLAVQRGDGVGAVARLEREDRHAEGLVGCPTG